MQNVRFREHIEHSDALWWFWWVQVIQCGHCVDDSEHDSCFYPIVDEVDVSQTHWKRAGILVRLHFWACRKMSSPP